MRFWFALGGNHRPTSIDSRRCPVHSPHNTSPLLASLHLHSSGQTLRKKTASSVVEATTTEVSLPRLKSPLVTSTASFLLSVGTSPSQSQILNHSRIFCANTPSIMHQIGCQLGTPNSSQLLFRVSPIEPGKSMSKPPGPRRSIVVIKWPQTPKLSTGDMQTRCPNVSNVSRSRCRSCQGLHLTPKLMQLQPHIFYGWGYLAQICATNVCALPPLWHSVLCLTAIPPIAVLVAEERPSINATYLGWNPDISVAAVFVFRILFNACDLHTNNTPSIETSKGSARSQPTAPFLLVRDREQCRERPRMHYPHPILNSGILPNLLTA